MKKKIKYFIIDLSKNNKFKKDKNSYFISIGKFGKILELIKSKKCKKVLFAGNIVKPRISKLKLDLKGIELSLLFKKGNNPFEGKKNKLTDRQIKKKKRLMKFAKKSKK